MGGKELRTKYVSGVLLSILLVASLIALPSFIITITSQTASASPPSENFTIVALPDTQFYSSSHPTIFDNQTNWIVQNENGMIQNENAQNIVFVAHLGDIVDTASTTSQWQNADTAMRILDNKVLYGILPGNHDLQDGGTNYSSYFPPSRYSYWDGSYVSYGPNNNLNNYQLFSAGGMNFIALDLEYDPPTDVMTWAGSVLDNYSDRRAIISTHAYLTYAGGWSQGGQNIHDNLVALHNNVFLVLCGHSYGSNGYGVWERTDTFGNRTVYQLLSDYQNMPLGGNGWLRIMKFVPSENKIYVKTYSPYAENYWTDSANQFEMFYPMSPTVAGGVSVSISPPSQENENGGTLTYTVTVMNLDNVQENYILTRGDNASWGLENLVLDNYWLLVPKGESRATKLNVTIPSNATNDTWDNIWVQATSKDNDNIWDNESCLAHMARTWTQASWSGGPTTPSLEVGTWSSSYDNFYRSENVDSSAGVRLSLPSTTGWLESSIFDAGSVADWGVLKWDASTPSSGSSDTYVSSYSAVKGTVTNFANQQSADDEGAYSTLAEESVTTQTSSNRGLYQDISATAGTSYTETAWVYSPAGTGSGGMGIVFTFFKSDGTYTSSSNAYNTSTYVWQQVTVTATAPALTVVACVRVRGYANSANPAGYADNLKFYVTSAPGTNLLSNPSLESWTGGVPDSWLAENYSDFRILQESGQVEDGSYSARIDTLFYTYDMQINENINSIPSADNQTLQLRYALANTNDTFNVQVWDGSAWNTRGSSLSSTSWTNWSYTLLSSEVIGGTVQVKFVDNNPSSTSQDNILIDYLRVESYSAPWSASIVVKLRTNTTAGDSDPYDGGWSDWYLHNNGAENTLMENGRYIQYRVELSTTDNTKTPELSEITLNYEVVVTTILGVSVSISPSSQENENGGTLTYIVTVTNTGNVSDTYTLENTDNDNWVKSLSNTSLVVAAFSSGNSTLSVTIPSDAVSGTSDNIIVTATSQENADVRDNASCIARAVTFLFLGTVNVTLDNLYSVTVNVNGDFGMGSNLVAKFYTYGGAYQDNPLVDNENIPGHVTLIKHVSRPTPTNSIQRVDLVVTDSGGTALGTIKTWATSHPVLISRVGQINGLWPFLSEAQKPTYVSELGAINGTWPFSPEA
jgi:hypothetical protein